MKKGTDCEPDLFRTMLQFYNYVLKTQCHLNRQLNTIQTYYNIIRTQSLGMMQTFLTLLITV